MERHGLNVLAVSKDAGVHLAVSPDGFRIVYFQGHPEYDDVSLLKEYKREILRYYRAESDDYPPFPENYFNEAVQAIFVGYEQQVRAARQLGLRLEEFPENRVLEHIDNTWSDTAKAVFNNWLGKIYQLTHQERGLPFMAGVDPNNPLGL